MNVTDALVELQKLTQTNLEILKGINSAFLSKSNHISVKIDQADYIIPSFLYLENKVNNIQANFDNLVHSPESGEAFFNFDGNSRAIEVRGYNHSPNGIILDKVNKFGIEQNKVFKDFLTPMPYIKFNLTTIPDDIVKVNVKKIVPYNQELISLLNPSDEVSTQLPYAEVYKMLSNYKENTDYITYDKIYSLPIRKNLGSGTYVIESIISDVVDSNLDNIITLKIKTDLPGYQNSLTYNLFDETISKTLSIGDQLVTYDDSAKLEIVGISSSERILKLRVMHGEFLNLAHYNPEYKEVSDLAKLKFFSTINTLLDKYINVPLEEDKNVYIAVAPLNSRMNIQSQWGVGVMLNTYKLVNDYDEELEFKKYYDENVRNIGDILYELSSMSNNSLTKYSISEFEAFTEKKPTIDTDNLLVVQVNRHLDNSTTIKNIRSLYAQKKKNASELQEVQGNINDINKKISEISFDDISELRSIYSSQLSELNSKKNELVSSITKNIELIAQEANNSEVPIENAKYRIRGFFDTIKFADNDIIKGHICGIRVEYRYKNYDSTQGNALTINDKFTYSDWNVMPGFDLPVLPYFDGSYKYKLQEVNFKSNDPSFNQIDIPITQGETVDIRLKVIYDFGRPFIETSSSWSDIINIKFPEEYLKNVEILDIINENNNDIETNRFQNILIDQGIINHIENKVKDQDITYFHKAESIASGFYTNERRIIPLKDKLVMMSDDITRLSDEVLDLNAEWLNVSVSIGDNINPLSSSRNNLVPLESYDQFVSIQSQSDPSNKTKILINSGTYQWDKDTEIVSTVANLNITNSSNHTVKLYSLFPGARTTKIKDLTFSIFDRSHYEEIKYLDLSTRKFTEQSCNQFVTFRVDNPYDGEEYYYKNSEVASGSIAPDAFDKLSNYIDHSKNYIDLSGGTFTTGSNKYNGLTIYPISQTTFSLCLNSDNNRSYYVIPANGTLTIPLMIQYRLKNGDSTTLKTRTISFDIRTSLYKDCINYTCEFTAKYISSPQDKLLLNSSETFNKSQLVKYNTVTTNG